MAGNHIVTSFDDDLSRLDSMIAAMGGLAEAQLAQAIDALVKRDAALAETIAARDDDDR